MKWPGTLQVLSPVTRTDLEKTVNQLDKPTLRSCCLALFAFRFLSTCSSFERLAATLSGVFSH